jgi:pilus assembly protein Flp/PilA
MRSFNWIPVSRVLAKAETAVNTVDYGLLADMRARSRRAARWLGADSESGVTAIEYALLASLIALAIIVAVTLVGTNMSGLFTRIAGKVS